MGHQVNKPLPCTVCGSPSIGRHLCRSHYNEAWRDGTLAKHSGITVQEAFEAKIKRGDGCWLWTGTKNGYGYGIFLLPGEVPVRAHRFSYTHFTGKKIPKGKIIMHTCDNPPCVNPDHLRVGTKNDNNKDTAIKRRHNYGLKHWNGRLSDADVSAIRASGDSHVATAKVYGVSVSHISRIRSGHSRR